MTKTVKTTEIEQTSPIDAVHAVLLQGDAVEALATETSGKMDAMLQAFVREEHLSFRLIDTWDSVYNANFWAYNDIDPDTGKATPIAGGKAPSKVATYKSQMLKAFIANNRTLVGIKDWAELKELIKKQDTQLEIDAKAAMTELQKVVKVAVKAGKINLEWIKQATKHIENNDGMLDD